MDTGLLGGEGDELDVDLGGEVGVAAEVPGEGELVRGLPVEDSTPVVFVAVGGAFVETAVDFAFYINLGAGITAEGVAWRPPLVDLFGPDAEGLGDVAVDGDGFGDDVW